MRNPARSLNDAEALLGSLAGVLSAHVVHDASGRIVEIHILASAALHPKQVVRNVESALSAGLEIEIDRRIVSVAQVRTVVNDGVDRGGNGQTATAAGASSDPVPDGRVVAGSAGEASIPSGGRLEFIRFQARREGDRCTCEVLFRTGGVGGSVRQELTGVASGSDSIGGRADAAARAVFEAVRTVRPGLDLELDGVSVTSTHGRTFVLVAAHVLQDRALVRLAGAAPVTRSPEEAAILAALQATNRWSG